MKTKILDSEKFSINWELNNFVNEKKIKQEDIQNIVVDFDPHNSDHIFFLFYWRYEE
jgi:hypothetical protein